MTSLRFLAALLVFVDHAPLTHDFSSRYGLGESGLGFFFVLSGFILTITYAENFGREISAGTLRRFYRARFARIYPVVFVSTLLAIAIVAIFGEPLAHRVPVWLAVDAVTRVGAIVSTFLLAQAWLPIPHLVLGVNPPAWSLSAEAFFYSCFPFIACYALRTRRAIGGAAMLLIALGTWAAFALWSVALRPQSFLLYYFPPIRLVDFAFGILIAAAFTGSRKPNRRIATLTEASTVAAVALALATLHLAPEALRYAAWMMPAWGALVFTFARQGGSFSAWLSTPALLHLGRISFGFYLVHYPITMALAAHGAAPAASFLALVLSVALSFLLFKTVEEPIRTWIMTAKATPFTRVHSNPDDGYRCITCTFPTGVSWSQCGKCRRNGV